MQNISRDDSACCNRFITLAYVNELHSKGEIIEFDAITGSNWKSKLALSAFFDDSDNNMTFNQIKWAILCADFVDDN